MSGAMYIWIMLAFFIGVVGVMALLIGIFWIGHWFEKRRGDVTHGFLEVPEGAKSRPAPRSADMPADGTGTVPATLADLPESKPKSE